MNLDGGELREILNFGLRNNTRGEWISDEHVAFVTDRSGRDQVGRLTLASGAVDWLGGEPELCPHDVVAGGAGRFALIAHDLSRSHAKLWDGVFSDLPNRSGRRSLLPHAALPEGGSTGFGHDCREAVKDDGWGGREQADIRAGIEACVAQGIAVKGKIAVVGNSYGGFSSWFAITRHADLVNAAIPMCGMYRLDIDYHETEMPHGRDYSREMMGGSPEELPGKYASASPGNFIENIRGQVMIVHGLADSNVGPANTHVAVRELTAAGIAHEVLLFYDEGHGVFRRSNVATYLERTAVFLERAFTP